MAGAVTDWRTSAAAVVDPAGGATDAAGSCPGAFGKLPGPVPAAAPVPRDCTVSRTLWEQEQ